MRWGYSIKDTWVANVMLSVRTRPLEFNRKCRKAKLSEEGKFLYSVLTKVLPSDFMRFLTSSMVFK